MIFEDVFMALRWFQQVERPPKSEVQCVHRHLVAATSTGHTFHVNRGYQSKSCTLNHVFFQRLVFH